jgi:hypothetical protein
MVSDCSHAARERDLFSDELLFWFTPLPRSGK